MLICAEWWGWVRGSSPGETRFYFPAWNHWASFQPTAAEKAKQESGEGGAWIQLRRRPVSLTKQKDKMKGVGLAMLNGGGWFWGWDCLSMYELEWWSWEVDWDRSKMISNCSRGLNVQVTEKASRKHRGEKPHIGGEEVVVCNLGTNHIWLIPLAAGRMMCQNHVEKGRSRLGRCL